jgi:putative transcriptional regulator
VHLFYEKHLILVHDYAIMFTMEKEVLKMPIQYKVDVMALLKAQGYTSTKIREEKLIGQSYLQQIRHGELVSWKTMETLCRLLDCQPADLIEYVPDAPTAE